MFKILTNASVRLVDRYLPDPYIFVILLTLVAAVAAIGIEGSSVLVVVDSWGNGFWGIMTFTLQMVMVLITGHMLASTPLVKKMLATLASTVRSPGSAIVITSLVALGASWLNWGFGLVVGALFAKEVALKVRVDYRLLIASAYSGFIVWHGGLAGSVPITIATEGHKLQDKMGLIPTSDTIFSTFNLFIVVCIFIFTPLVNRWMLPKDEESVYVDREKLIDPIDTSTSDSTRPADRIENSYVLTVFIALLGFAYIFRYFFVQGKGLDLNSINLLFLMLAILLHGTPKRLLESLNIAIKGSAGIIIQFPFYAGILGIMTGTGLAATLSNWMVSFATAETLSFWTFISAGILNIFIPSGGGQWAVQGPIAIDAAQRLGADLAHVSMAVAWGDSWTNMLQPFWALPILAIAGLKAKDIMGFCLIQLFLTGIIISIGLSFF